MLFWWLSTSRAHRHVAPLVETSSPPLDRRRSISCWFWSNFWGNWQTTSRIQQTICVTTRRTCGINLCMWILSARMRCQMRWTSPPRSILSRITRWVFLLKFPQPISLNEAISQVVRCDNRLFEFWQEEHPHRIHPPWPAATRSHLLWLTTLPPMSSYTSNFNSHHRF